MNLLNLNLRCSSKLLFCVHQDSDTISLLDSDSLAVLKTFHDPNQFSKNCLAVAEKYASFVTFAKNKSVFSFWTFDDVG